MLLPDSFISATRNLGITQDRKASPLTRTHNTYWSEQEADVVFGSQGQTYATRWTGASLLQMPGRYNLETTKGIRWALASTLDTEEPVLTMVTFPDTPGAYYKQLTQHSNIYDMGVMHNNRMKRVNHWTYPLAEQEISTNKKQYTRVLIIANKAGTEKHLQPHQWKAFTDMVEREHPNRLKMPTKTVTKDPTNSIYKPPKAFTDLKKTEAPRNTNQGVDRTEARKGSDRLPLCRDHTATIYTDGSCIKQKAANSLGAAFRISLKGVTKVTHVNTGGKNDTNTNNRAELSAIHMALQDISIIKEDVTLFTDSLWSLQVLHKTLHDPQRMEMGKHRELLEAG